MKRVTQKKLSIKKLLLTYGFHIWFLIFLLNVVIFFTTQYHARSQTCFTTAQVQSDSRCLYIVSGRVYEKDTRTSSHRGHPCGTDVTSTIPSSHIDGIETFLTPNYLGDICAAPTTAPTTAPTAQPTNTVPSPQCLGGCFSPAPTAIPTTVVVPSVNPNPNPPNNGGGNNGGLLGLLLALLKALLELFLGLFR